MPKPTQALDEHSAISQLKSELELLRGYSHDVIYRLRYDNMVYEYISPSVERLIGFTAEELQKMNLRSLIEETRMVSDSMRPVTSFESLEAARKRGQVLKWQADYKVRTKDGRRIWLSDVSYPWFDDSGAIIGSVGTLRDITERVTAEERAKEDAAASLKLDELTGLLSRPVFFDKVEEELKRLKRTRSDVSVIVLSIDCLKEINEYQGRIVGDEIVREITGIVKRALRETDSAGRTAGNEFAICLPDTPAKGAFWVAERIRETVIKQQFFNTKNEMIGCTVSLGVASACFDDQMRAGDLFKAAESRLFIARHTGENKVSVDELVNLH